MPSFCISLRPRTLTMMPALARRGFTRATKRLRGLNRPLPLQYADFGLVVEATDAGLWLLTANSAGQLSSEFVANTEIEHLPHPVGEGRGEGLNASQSDTELAKNVTPHPNPLPQGEGTKRDDRYVKSPVSLMPDTRELLSREEVDCLVAFLKNRHGGQDK